MSNIYNVYKNLSEQINPEELENIKPSTFYKYLSLYKKAGFSVVRLKKFYKIIKYSNSVKLSDAEIGLIAYLKLLSYMFFSKTKDRIFSKFIEKILKYTNKQTENAVNSKYNLIKEALDTNLYKEKLELFENYKSSNSKVVVLTKNNKRMTLVAKEVIFKNKRIYFSFIDNKTREIKQIDINKIISMTPFKNESLINYEAQEIIFELYGRLAKIYLLKDGERVVDCSKDKLIIANAASDKEKLFKRLLRYDSLCKVKFPKKDAEEFKKIIEKSLENIEGIKDNIYKEDLN